MAVTSAFVDTSGFFALLAKQDPARSAALHWLDQLRLQRQRSLTTDYILDETATLLKARERSEIIRKFFALVFSSDALLIEWISANRLTETTDFFVRQADHGYSFTDCASFLVMREFALTAALTTDRHF